MSDENHLRGPSVRGVPEGDNRERMICAECGYILYDNPKIVVGSVCLWQERFLLCRRAINPRHGFWTLPAGYLEVVPELVFEVRSPTDRWSRLITKAGEYLEAGVTVVCLLDQVSETVQVYRADELPRTLHGEDELNWPDVLGELRVPVRRFFE